MRKKIIIGLACYLSRLSYAACNFTQVPSIQFSCPPSQAECASTSTLSVMCSANEIITGTLSTGISGSFSPRTMKTPQNAVLNYNVYLDANQQQVFGDGTQATSIINTTCAGTCNFNLYAYTFGSSPVRAGNYSDNLILMISY